MLYNFTVQDLVKTGRLGEDDLTDFKNWLAMQELPKFSDEQLALFYLSCDKNLENSKKCALNYYYSRRDGPELFDDRDILRKDIQHQLKILNFCVLPRRTDEGHVICLHRLVDTDASQYHMEVAMKVLFMTMDSSYYDDPPTGIISLMDMQGVGLRHITRMRLGAIKKFFHYVQEGMPLKLVSVHVMNVVWFFDRIFKIVKPFMKAETLKHLHFHSPDMKMDDFYENFIPKHCLPLDYGGDLKSVYEMQKDTVQKLTEMQEYFIKEQLVRN